MDLLVQKKQTCKHGAVHHFSSYKIVNNFCSSKITNANLILCLHRAVHDLVSFNIKGSSLLVQNYRCLNTLQCMPLSAITFTNNSASAKWLMRLYFEVHAFFSYKITALIMLRQNHKSIMRSSTKRDNMLLYKNLLAMN